VNKPKALCNAKACAFLSDYANVSELCRDHPQVDDLFSGVLALKTAGNTATRSLSRCTLFQILQRCPVITVAAAIVATNNRYASSTIEGYAAAARVASRAITSFMTRFPDGRSPRAAIKQAQELMDAAYHSELAALGLM
jgi:hypothetical protein